jgi:hypothetical protein
MLPLFPFLPKPKRTIPNIFQSVNPPTSSPTSSHSITSPQSNSTATKISSPSGQISQTYGDMLTGAAGKLRPLSFGPGSGVFLAIVAGGVAWGNSSFI